MVLRYVYESVVAATDLSTLTYTTCPNDLSGRTLGCVDPVPFSGCADTGKVWSDAHGVSSSKPTMDPTQKASTGTRDQLSSPAGRMR